MEFKDMVWKYIEESGDGSVELKELFEKIFELRDAGGEGAVRDYLNERAAKYIVKADKLVEKINRLS